MTPLGRLGGLNEMRHRNLATRRVEETESEREQATRLDRTRTNLAAIEKELNELAGYANGTAQKAGSLATHHHG